MDFRDSPQEAEFRAAARAFLEAHGPRGLPDYFDEDVELDHDAFLDLWKPWQRKLYDEGWASITWPKAFGGRGLGPIEQIVWNQELARAGIGESLFVVGTGLAGPTIISHGSEEQKQRYLEPLLRGDEIWCQLFSEPGAGSDLGALATRAVRDGDDWIVTGQKTWCSGGHYGDYGILLTRSDPTLPKHKGITYFLLDMHLPGVEILPLRQMTGGSHFNEVFLNEVRVPDSARLGPEGAGWGAAMTTLMNERIHIGGVEGWLNFDDLTAHARENARWLDPVLRDELARLFTWVRSLELLNARVITKLGHGEIPTSESSVMKLSLARIVSKASKLGIDLLGPDGLRRRGTWQNQFLGAPALHIAGGTDEIQKNVAAERVLGLPREPRTDHEVPFEDLTRS